MRIRLSVGLVILVSSFCFLGCSKPSSPSPDGAGVSSTQSSTQSTTQQPKANGGESWKEFVSKEGRFRVLMPSEPTYVKKDFPSEAGNTRIHKFTVLRNDNKEMFLALYMDIGDPSALDNMDELLVTLGNGIAGDAKGRVVARRKVSLGTVPGSEVKVETPNGIITARVYVTRERMYQVSAGMPTQKPNSEDVAKFLDSLQLLK